MGTSSSRPIRLATMVAIAVLGGCTTSPNAGTTTSITTSTLTTESTIEINSPGSSTTLPPSTTSTPVTTSTSTITSTSAPVDNPPGSVSGVTTAIGGGSGEVIVEWDRGTEPDLDHYNVWYSLTSSVGKTLLATVDHLPGSILPPAYDAGSGRTAYVDFPRDQAEGTECYQISAVDTAGNEGDRSAEACLPSIPPDAVLGFSVGTGGGSGEVFVTWQRNTEPDIDHYNLWYSELPGQSKVLLGAVAHSVGDIDPPAYDAGGGMTAYIDFPREITNGKQCYEISAVDVGGNEGTRSAELCLTDL